MRYRAVYFALGVRNDDWKMEIRGCVRLMIASFVRLVDVVNIGWHTKCLCIATNLKMAPAQSTNRPIEHGDLEEHLWIKKLERHCGIHSSPGIIQYQLSSHALTCHKSIIILIRRFHFPIGNMQDESLYTAEDPDPINDPFFRDSKPSKPCARCMMMKNLLWENLPTAMGRNRALTLLWTCVKRENKKKPDQIPNHPDDAKSITPWCLVAVLSQLLLGLVVNLRALLSFR